MRTSHTMRFPIRPTGRSIGPAAGLFATVSVLGFSLLGGLLSCSSVDPLQGEESEQATSPESLDSDEFSEPILDPGEGNGEIADLESGAFFGDSETKTGTVTDSPLTAVSARANVVMQKSEEKPSYNELTEREQYILLQKGTERAGTGELLENKVEGTYICRQCNAALYTSDQKFESHCGWPSFDDDISDAVRRETDRDGRRTEILCKNCDGHLGHVFLGEGFTPKNTRHCVNSVSMKFVPADQELPPKITLKP